MADVIKLLGQVQPAGGTLTTLYTVPSLKSTVVSSIVVTNIYPQVSLFRISIAVAGAADTTSQYLYYDVAIGSNFTFTATLGVSLATTDVVRVQSNTGALNFTLFGVEVT